MNRSVRPMRFQWYMKARLVRSLSVASAYLGSRSFTATLKGNCEVRKKPLLHQRLG